MYGYGYGRPAAYVPPAYGPAGGAGYGVDVNGDGVVDYNVRPGVGVDVDGDGIVDYRTGPTVTPGPGMAYGGAYGGYGYGYRRYGY